MRRTVFSFVLLLGAALPVRAQQALPLKHTPVPTTAAITAADLMTRLYIFADDSMMGRTAGTIWNLKGTEYIASEVKRLGLQPAGDNGTYFQNVGIFTRALDPASSITVAGTAYPAGKEWIGNVPNQPRPMSSMEVVFGGNALDTVNILDASQVGGKLVLLYPFTQQLNQEQIQHLIASEGYKKYVAAIQTAGAVASIVPQLNPGSVKNAFEPRGLRVALKSDKPSAAAFSVTNTLAEAMLGTPLASATKGMSGKTVTVDLKYVDTPKPGRNVVAIIPGTDPKLKNEYVAIGAHNDHIPLRQQPVDHDSLRAFNTIARPGGVEDAPKTPSAEEWTRINFMKDSLRTLHGGMRIDSINNGADDDGTGSMGVLEIAEAFAKSPGKPKRSLLFVWHAGEELGMYGSNYFTDNPTVPRDSIVAQLNVDMIGRGGPQDVPNGGPGYLQLIGSHRLSTELGDVVEAVNKDTKAGFNFDYQYDTNGNPHQYYCRSDHWAYARYGIPITFFTTGGHRDYHMVTDEPQYIDYDKYAHVTQLIHDIAWRVANLDHRVLIDHAKGDPYGQCQQ